MRRTIAGILIGMFVGAAVEAQVFSNYYSPEELFEKPGGALTEDNYYHEIRMGYATGVADAMTFVVEYGSMSKNSFDDDYAVMARIDECLKFRGTTKGALEAYARGLWWKAKNESMKESAAAILAASCAGGLK